MNMDLQTTMAFVMLTFWSLCVITSIGFKIWAKGLNRGVEL